jgi:hypothetical protein
MYTRGMRALSGGGNCGCAPIPAEIGSRDAPLHAAKLASTSAMAAKCHRGTDANRERCRMERLIAVHLSK